MNRRISMGGAVALGLSVFLVAPAAHADEPGTPPAATATIHVPSDFDTSLADTRINGYKEVVGTGLHIWTDGSEDVDPTTGKNSDKVAEYVDSKTPLARVGEPTLEYTDTDPSAALGAPGFQLVVDLDGDHIPDGILVGEPGAYHGDWWLSSAWTNVDLRKAPGAKDGYDHAGTLDEWRAAFRSAKVLAFGFSLGSGVHGDGTINAIDFANTRYTFAADVVPQSSSECKGGGWGTSTDPVYKNQGECVSQFATTSTTSGVGAHAPVSAATGTTTATGATAVLTARNSGKIRAI